MREQSSGTYKRLVAGQLSAATQWCNVIQWHIDMCVRSAHIVASVTLSGHVEVILFEARKHLKKRLEEQEIVCRGLLVVGAVMRLVCGPAEPDARGLLDIQDRGLLVPAVLVQLDGAGVVGEAEGSVLCPESVRNRRGSRSTVRPVEELQRARN